MNDEQMQSLLDTWFEDTNSPTPPDTRRTAVAVMARVPYIRQRGRWLPFPLLRRKAQTATATDTIDYRPSPIPAASGHAPTVIGRTQTMFSPVKTITLGALVFAIGGAFLIAQPFDQEGDVVPAASILELPADTVTATQDCNLYATPVTCTYVASDPRVTGTLTFEFTGDIGTLDTGGVEFMWNDATLEGPEGDWTGHYYLMWGYGREVLDGSNALTVLSGTGAYEGWQYIATSIDPQADGDADLVGVIYEGELPPYGPPSASRGD